MANKPERKDNQQPSVASGSIRAVAIYEVVKGLIALISAGSLWLWHADLQRWLATALPSSERQYGQLLAPLVESAVDIAQRASQSWMLFLLLIVIYAGVRFVEAYGLWQDKTWAYWISIIGYGIFICLEIYYLATSSFDWFKLVIFISNIIVVIVVYRNMKRKGLI